AVQVTEETRGSAAAAPTAAPSTLSTPATLRLDAGEEAQVAAGGAVVKHPHADLPRATAWREHRLVFREDRMEDIAAEFARYSPRQIVLADEAAREKRITGTFDE